MLKMVRSKKSYWRPYAVKYHKTATILQIWIPPFSAQTHENECSHFSCHFPSSRGSVTWANYNYNERDRTPHTLGLPTDSPLLLTCCPSLIIHFCGPCSAYILHFFWTFIFPGCGWMSFHMYNISFMYIILMLVTPLSTQQKQSAYLDTL